MWLENLSFDAVDPQRLGRFWSAALGASPLTDTPELFEARLAIPHGPTLDLCFQRVTRAPSEPLRLHLDLLGGARQAEVARRLRDVGATDLDIGQGDVPWIVMADVEGNPFCVMEERAVYTGTGPIAAVPIDSADPDRDAAFWSELSGWQPVSSPVPALRHRSGRGPLLEFCPEPEPKRGKNRLHLDLRLQVGDDESAVVGWMLDHGAAELRHDWGELPWRVFTDPSGNEFCLLRATNG